MSLVDERQQLFDALSTVVPDHVIVSKYPAPRGINARRDGLIQIMAMGIENEFTDYITADLEVQVGISEHVDSGFELMDALLWTVDRAIPVNWEAAEWLMEVGADDDPMLYARATIRGHPLVDQPPVDFDTILWSDDPADFIVISYSPADKLRIF